MRLRLPLTVLLCLAIIATFAVPAAADGPSDGDTVSAAAIMSSRAGSQPWQRGRLDADDVNDLGSFPSIATDPVTGTTWAAFYDATNHDLVVARRVDTGGNCGSGGTWSCTTVDSTGDVGRYVAIAINPATSEPAVAYSDATNHQLKYAFLTCPLFCVWVASAVDGTFAADSTFASLAIDSAGKAYISYHGAWGTSPTYMNGLFYAHQVDSGGNCGVGTAAGKWQCEPVADTLTLLGSTGLYTSIALNGAGLPRIAYYDNLNDNLDYAWLVGSGGSCGANTAWSCITVDSAGDVGRFASLSYASGDAQIAYYDYSLGDLKYAKWYGTATTHNCGPSNDWQCDVIDDSVGAGATIPVSLAVEGNGSAAYPYEPVIAYYDISGSPAGNGMLKAARPAFAGNCGPTVVLFGYTWYTWQCSTVDSGLTNVEGTPYATPHNVGYGVAVATNGTGLATIAYYDSDARDLLVAYQRYAEYMPLQLRELPHP